MSPLWTILDQIFWIGKDTFFDGKNSRFAGLENIDGSPMDEQDECFFDNIPLFFGQMMDPQSWELKSDSPSNDNVVC